MAWVLLLAASPLEIAWAFTIKLSQGFTHPTIVTSALPAWRAARVNPVQALRGE